MFSKHSQSLKVLTILTVSMTVSHLYQNLENIKGVRSLKQASESVDYCDKRASHSVDAPPPWFGGGDHLCPYGRKLIGSLVPVHSRSVRSNIYAFLDQSLKLVAFLLNYLIIFLFFNTYRSLFKASDTFDVFQVLIKMADSHRNCQHQ